MPKKNFRPRVHHNRSLILFFLKLKILFSYKCSLVPKMDLGEVMSRIWWTKTVRKSIFEQKDCFTFKPLKQNLTFYMELVSEQQNTMARSFFVLKIHQWIAGFIPLSWTSLLCLSRYRLSPSLSISLSSDLLLLRRRPLPPAAAVLIRGRGRAWPPAAPTRVRVHVVVQATTLIVVWVAYDFVPQLEWKKNSIWEHWTWASTNKTILWFVLWCGGKLLCSGKRAVLNRWGEKLTYLIGFDLHLLGTHHWKPSQSKPKPSW